MRKSRHFVFHNTIAKFIANLLLTFFLINLWGYIALFDSRYKAIVAELKQKAIWPYSGVVKLGQYFSDTFQGPIALCDLSHKAIEAD